MIYELGKLKVPVSGVSDIWALNGDARTPFLTYLEGKGKAIIPTTDVAAQKVQIGQGYNESLPGSNNNLSEQDLVNDTLTADSYAERIFTNSFTSYAEKISVSEYNLATRGTIERNDGMDIEGLQIIINDTIAREMPKKVEKMRRKYNTDLITSTEVEKVDETTATKMAGIIDAATRENEIDTTGAILDNYADLESYVRSAYQAGCTFAIGSIVGSRSTLVRIRDLSIDAGNQQVPDSREIAGLNIMQVYIDSTLFDLVPDDSYPDETSFVLADVSYLSTVGYNLLGGGVFRTKPVIKDGLAQEVNLYADLTLGYSSPFRHAAVTNFLLEEAPTA